ncbi:LytTR family DNA-binding domain-containing protein [Pelagovum pacificum]|uniref:LytTR family DNA-binding domain-containing protein n=1 Tax=Pelagovum pacificum TaxID=2588711 RepID=UPI0018CFD22D|nr:LytTR family DNA-binding domain-containing protein [Pelagovum pacificum]QQA42048.1 LytTR family transcriptional regulator [Pelagovum pacificum]
MNHPGPSLALREVREHLSQPKTLIGMVGVAVILGISGPFETGQYPVAGRLAYWAGVVAATYATGVFCGTLLAPRLSRLARPARVALIGLATGLAVTLVVAAVNLVLLGMDVPTFAESARFTLSVVAISIAVTAVSVYLSSDTDHKAGSTQDGPLILSRLPLEKRGQLLSLSAEDHYVRVRTNRGEELLLMRLADAIRETGQTEGLQVHRSHWVATDAVRAVRRSGDRAILTLTDGATVPASRTNLPALRNAGLLERR